MVRHVLLTCYPGNTQVLLELSCELPIGLSSAERIKWLKEMISQSGETRPIPITQVRLSPIEMETMFNVVDTQYCDSHVSKRAKA